MGVTLRRSISFPLLTLYGLGNIVGAGIYVLLGEVAAVAGPLTPAAFLLAFAVAGLTALSYAELAARMPLAAGEAVYFQRAFGLPPLSAAAGLLIAAAGTVSAAALVRGLAGYVAVLAPLPHPITITAAVVGLGGLTVWGIEQSLRTAAVLTLIEVGGLLLVMAAVGDGYAALTAEAGTLVPGPDPGAWQAVVAGAFLAFYAFIGFEDMVKVAEEVRRPVRDMPRAIFWALGMAGGLYVLLAVGAVLAIPPEELAGEEAPLARIYAHATGRAPVAITLIGLVAAVNGVLAQIIMASRMLYGLAGEGWLPALLGRVSPRTRTPLPATLLVAGLVLALALAFPVAGLAGVTSALILVVFAGVNLALWRLKGAEARPGFGWLPRWVPVLALAAALALVAVGALAPGRG